MMVVPASRLLIRVCYSLQLNLVSDVGGKEADGLGLETCIVVEVAIITRLGFVCVVEVARGCIARVMWVTIGGWMNAVGTSRVAASKLRFF
jgi:hypothetical protein